MGLFAMPWERIHHWYLCMGAWKLRDGKLKAKHFWPSGCNVIVKKQAFKSIIVLKYANDIATGEGRPGFKAPINIIVLLTALRSCRTCHFSDFFLITKIDLFQRELLGMIWPAYSCSCPSFWARASFSLGWGHWLTHTGSLVIQMILSTWETWASMAPVKNFWSSSRHKASKMWVPHRKSTTS